MASFRIGITDGIAYLYRGVRRYAVLGKFTDTATDVVCLDDTTWKDFVVIQIPNMGVYRVYSTAEGAEPQAPELLVLDENAVEVTAANEVSSTDEVEELQPIEVIKRPKVDIRKERDRRLVKNAKAQHCTSLLEGRRMSKKDRLKHWLEDRRNGKDKRLVDRYIK